MNKEIENQIKIKELQLQVLDMKIENTPYSRASESIHKKKQVILKEIQKLKQS